MRCCLLHLPAAFFISAYSAVTYYHIENDYSVKLTQKATVCHHNKTANGEKPPQSNEIIYISCKIIGLSLIHI